MQLEMETFNVIHKPCCYPSHSSCRKDPEDDMDMDCWNTNWKSPMKIMMKLLPLLLIIILNVGISLGINNLWSHNHQQHSKSRPSRKHGMSIWSLLISTLIICLSLLAVCSQAYPMRDHQREGSSRRNFLSPSFNGDYAGQRSFSAQSNTSGDNSSLSLSIFSPLDILRQNMLLEIQRKRYRHAKQRQVQSNKEYLDRIG